MNLGTQEFPEILIINSICISQPNLVVVLEMLELLYVDLFRKHCSILNGVPVNDMENGRVYWSNWAGLSDVNNCIAVQRGLGASKVSISSSWGNH